MIGNRFTAKGISITLFQYSICPFYHKVKALLEYASQPYDMVEVNPLTKRELKSLSSSYRKVPIALVDGEQVNGSDAILASLLRQPMFLDLLRDKRGESIAPTSFLDGESSRKWRGFAQNELAALLYPNICPSLMASVRAFRYVDSVRSFSHLDKLAIKGIGSMAMYLAASKVKWKHGIVDGKKALMASLSRFQSEGIGDATFTSRGELPNMGDLVVYGKLSSIEGFLVHRDTVYCEDLAKLRDWYVRMRREVHGDEQG